MESNSNDIDIVILEAEHVPRLFEIVRMNDPAIPHLMQADVTRWLSAGRPEGEAYFVALGPGGPIGMTGFRPDPWGVEQISWLVWLYIDHAWKRRGIARLLFGHAQRILRQRGCRKVYLDVGNEQQHRAAIAFHQRDGFVLEGHLRDYWDRGEDFLIFGKVL